MTRNSTRKKAIRERMEQTGEPYSEAARQMETFFGVPVLIGEEKCPGHFTWSAFGAPYPDTVCATVISWDKEGYIGWGLCDADDDFREKGIPCPFHHTNDFISYSNGGGYWVPYWTNTNKKVPDRTEFHIHEKGQSLSVSATHFHYGELEVEFREEVPEKQSEDSFVPYLLSNGEEL